MPNGLGGDDFAQGEGRLDKSFSNEQLWKEVDSYVQRFEEAWQKGGQPNIDDFLPRPDRPPLYRAVLIELVEVDLERRLKHGKTARWEDYLKRYPQLADNPTVVFTLLQSQGLADPLALPDEIGGYRIEKTLGCGSFGVVYLAHDDHLSRHVAIKVPHRKLVARPEDAGSYRAEARVVAALNHPNIVPVYHVGSTADHPFFIVSKFITGGTLARRIRLFRPSAHEAAKLVSVVADALHHAHLQGLVHRDIKPGNILLERIADGGQPSVPHVADFGLALREKDFGKGAALVGTPAYMSPEQARGEGNRVNGRSDIFSLGVVFYELLTGVRPFQSDTVEGLLDQIRNADARPPRQRDDSIHPELERICLKALARRASERYTTAKDFCNDLRFFLAELAADNDSGVRPKRRDEPPIKIVPKGGLRSYEAHDADFFLELLPGARDRYGLPDSIRFWKTRIEEKDEANTFSVGLVYGPSGCGKSSLVKAGLLPRLKEDVVVVYIEASTDETEARLVSTLRRRLERDESAASLLAAGSGFSGSASPGLKETLTALRRGEFLPSGKKVLIVLDQFEQWLHGEVSRERKRPETDSADLVVALRQCDGRHVQCLVMVRHDFWLAVSRFFKELEVPLVEGHNSALVDLFDLDHAKKVLAAFGRAFGRLPEDPTQTSKEDKQFLEQAVMDLAQEDKVVCVRLALFAEWMKSKPWTPEMLKAVGGATGVGAKFLEETFSGATAPPAHRAHQLAARNVLQALLPESGTDIKGHMRSYQELLKESGYARRPSKVGSFDELLSILNGELLLITPTDPEGAAREEGGARNGADRQANVNEVAALAREPAPAARYYQLTHDYLVHSLRDWLTRKQKETRRGRTELLLADRASVWNARPENRQLPSLWQWCSIRWLTQKKNWTLAQRKMMRKATRFHAVRGLVVAICVTLLGLVGWEINGRGEARTLRDRLLAATTVHVPAIVKEMAPYRGWLDPLLYAAYAQAAKDKDRRKQLYASLALLPVDSGQMEYLYGRLLEADPEDVLVIRNALFDSRQDLTERLSFFENPKKDPDPRFRAGCALAAFAPNDPRWDKARDDVAGELAAREPFEIARWTEVLKPVQKMLLPPLADFLEDEKRSPAERRLICNIYGSYAADVPDAYARLEKRLADASASDARMENKLELTKKRANVGVGLLVMGRGDEVWPLLKHSPDPTLRSFLIERIGPGGVAARLLLARLAADKDSSIRRALLLSLGEYRLDRLPPAERENLLPGMLDLYRNDPDPGIHGAARWLLKQWQAEEKINEIDEASRVASPPGTKRGWCVTGQGQTMVFIPKPRDGVFWMGEGQERHQQPMGHDFALSSEDVTVAQFLQFCKDKGREYKYQKRFAPTQDCPAIEVTWYEAAAYCNWLSKREGIVEAEWCYEPNQAGQFAEGMKIKAGYLRLQGYRLPTESEWEYACRAGSTVGYSFGEPPELLEKFGWFVGNALSKTHPGGMKKPNDLGLFDMHGNVWQWTQTVDNDQPAHEEDEGGELVDGKSKRVNRGGSWNYAAGVCRSATRFRDTPISSYSHLGFRLARVPTWVKCGVGQKSEPTHN